MHSIEIVLGMLFGATWLGCCLSFKISLPTHDVCVYMMHDVWCTMFGARDEDNI